jgi:Pin2-interacting protein X1
LNGNEEEVKKEEERQEKVQQKAYVYRKFGFMNFVSGGYLVGGEITRDVKKEVEVKTEIKIEVKSEPESSDSEIKEKKSKKRKRSGEGETIEGPPKLKRKKKSIDLRQDVVKETETDESATKSKREKREMKDKKSKKSSSSSSATNSPAPTSGEPLTEKTRRKAEKRANKEEKKLKKALKKAAKEAARSNPTNNDPSSESEEEEDNTLVDSEPTTGTSTPRSAVGLTFNAGGRHAVRRRYIQQKRMAFMDPQALKEVCHPWELLFLLLLTCIDFHGQDSCIVLDAISMGFSTGIARRFVACFRF